MYWFHLFYIVIALCSSLGGKMKQTLSPLVIEEELLKSLLFNHKIDFFQFTDAVLLLKEKHKDSGKDTQLAITK